MTKQAIPPAVLAQHLGVFGKTGRGKTTTAKDCVEQVFDEDFRVCIIDPIKSDWWGLTSSADGKRAGLPFYILGGPHAHLPLASSSGKAIADLVARGQLRHTIIDMAEFEPGGQLRWFVDFAPCLMQKMKGVLYLVIEEAHMFAPKERAGMGHENMSIHWAKMLATAGRTKGIRLIVLSQRTQALHNAVIGSCDSMIVHGFTAPADMEPLIKWMKANTKDKELIATIEGSLSGLKTGSGWICSSEAGIFALHEFPKARTYDNTATPEDDSELATVKQAPVDLEALRSILGKAAEDADADDPKKLKDRIRELERAKPAMATDSRVIEQARAAGFENGFLTAKKEGFGGERTALANRLGELRGAIDQLVEGVQTELRHECDSGKGFVEPVRKQTAFTQPHIPAPERIPLNAGAKRILTEEDGVSGVQQRILNALAELEGMGARQPDRAIVVFMSGYSNANSKGFANAIGALKSAGHVDYPGDGSIVLTSEGRQLARPPNAPRTPEELQQRLISMLGGASGKVLQPLIDRYPKSMPRGDLAIAAGYGNVNSKGFANAIGRLSGLGFIGYPEKGQVAAKPVLFLEGA